MNLNAIQILKKTVEKYHYFVILPHVMPDGDAIGSSAALAQFFHNAGKKAIVLVEDKVPSNLGLIPRHLFVELENFKEPQEEYVAIAIDSSDIGRLGKRIDALPNRILLAVIDHHHTNTCFGSVNYIDEHASSTGEIIYELAGELGFPLDHVAATALFISLSTDTGSFRYANTTPKTLRIAADLMGMGIDTIMINTELYQNQPLRKVQLQMDALSHMELIADNRVALVLVTCEMMAKHGALYEDTDGLSEYVRGIQGVEVVAIFKELGGGLIKISMRSKYNFDVSAVVSVFDGGGHKRAAGCTVQMSAQEALGSIKKEILERLE